ncbi:MAG: chorismate synthase, partial [Campylobacter sp.]|nr:chorismate synthase [Campylobacter sp.]
DYRGGGRSSARESAVRVAGGAIAQMFLNEFKIVVESGVLSIGENECSNLDFDFAKNSEIFALDKNCEESLKAEILKAKKAHDSVGGVILTRIKNAPFGLGEVLYDKFDARIAAAMMGINAVKAVEIGLGTKASQIYASQNNDEINEKGFISNNAGGILGGITNGEDIIIKTHFKPTPSIFIEQKTINSEGKEITFELHGRHDPCVAIRGSVVANAMARLVVADMMLLNASSSIEKLKKIYI